MTQEDKELLLKDLCARLPYGVKVKYYSMEYPYGTEKPVKLTPYLLNDRWYNIVCVEPYLRPMSSMTEEEAFEFGDTILNAEPEDLAVNKIDWLNAHHFDYRGLIEKGLALEAPSDMYKTE